MKILIVSADRTLASGHPQNIGDAFLTDALSRAFRGSGCDVVIADFGVADRVSSTETRARIGGLGGLAKLIRSVDVVILGGGTLLADDQPTRRFAGLPRLCAATAVLARGLGKKFVVLGVGVDPVSRRWARLAIGATLRLGRVWVRDVASAARAAELMSRTPAISGDVSLFEAEFWGAPREDGAGGGGVAGHPEPAAQPGEPAAQPGGAVLALNRREAAALSEETVAALESAHGSVTFIAMDQGDDADGNSLSPAVAARLAYSAEPAGWRSVFERISGADVVVASRMHAMYMGVMASVPVVAISGAPKVDAFIAQFHVSASRTLADVAAVAGAVDPEAVQAAVSTVRTAQKEVMAWTAR